MTLEQMKIVKSIARHILATISEVGYFRPADNIIYIIMPVRA